MKFWKENILIIMTVCYTSAVFAAPTFSPYADVTINTHWDSQYNDMEPADLVKVSQENGVKSYHLAFITDAGQCQAAWGGQASYAVNTNWGAHLTDALRANNIQYSISFGGQSGADLSQACSASQLVTSLEQTISVYQPQGLDFDIENGSANVPNLMTALQQVQHAYPNLKISFTLPVLPEGLTAQGKDVLKQARNAGLIYKVNIMAMDYGPAYVNSMGQYAIQAANNLFDFLKELYPTSDQTSLWQMIEVTPMIGVNDVSVEQFTLADVDVLQTFALQSKLGGLSMWSINRDFPCADKWASPVCSGDNLQKLPYEFSKQFMK